MNDSKKTKKRDPFKRNADDAMTEKVDKDIHVLDASKHIICRTDNRGYKQSRNLSPLELKLDASEGFIPLWGVNTTLRWRFNDTSMKYFESPESAKKELRTLFGEAILAWDYAAPVKFAERTDLWDFEIAMQNADDCDSNGCVLASAFFPDGGRHRLRIYPKFFTQSREERVETLIHEIGHVFGLRHFFANISELDWPSEVFGVDDKFSIMNYGQLSQLTEADKSDLARLYQSVWSQQLTEINGTRIKLFRPYHESYEPVAPPINYIHLPAPPIHPHPATPYANSSIPFSAGVPALRNNLRFTASADQSFVRALWYAQLAADSEEAMFKVGASWESRDLKTFYKTEALVRKAADSVMKQAIDSPINDLTSQKWQEFHERVKLATIASSAITSTVDIAITATASTPIL